MCLIVIITLLFAVGEQTSPLTDSSGLLCRCRFDVEFHDMMTKMFEGKKLEEATHCPTCNQPRSAVVD